MATANTLSQSVAPIPFLWILPLSVYLLTLILCFDREGWYRPSLYRVALPAACMAMGWCAGDRGAGNGRPVDHRPVRRRPLRLLHVLPWRAGAPQAGRGAAPCPFT